MSRPPRVRARARALGALAVAAAAGLALALAPGASAAPAGVSAGVPVGVSVGVSAARPEAQARAQAAHDRLDRKARQAPEDVAGWYVDDATGQTVVSVVGGRTPAADAFAADQDPAAVRVETGAQPPRLLAAYPLVGGQAIYGGNFRCSIGFSVRKGSATDVLTAGHCTEDASTWRGYNNATLGRNAVSKFPTDDYGMIAVTNPAWTPTGRVQGGPSVTGATPAAVGATVCRSGSTSGYRCGQIVSKNQTVNYGGGDVVSGLTRTTACAEAGDSGGPFLEPSTRQAQGLTSGGTGNCSSGGVTFFEPIGKVLSRLGVTLVTGG